MKLRKGLAAVIRRRAGPSRLLERRRRIDGGDISADTEGTLEVWLMDGSQPEELIDAVNAKFNEAYPNVDVQVEIQQWSGIQDKLTTSLNTDSTPDVGEIGNSVHREVRRRRPARRTGTSRTSRSTRCCRACRHPANSTAPATASPTTAASGSWRTRRATSPRPECRGAYLVGGTGAGGRRGSAGCQRQQPEVLRVVLPRQVLVRRCAVRLGRWRRDGRAGVAASGPARLDSAESQAGLATLKNLVDNYSKAPKDGDETKNDRRLQHRQRRHDDRS